MLVGVAERGRRVAHEDQRRGGDRRGREALEVALEGVDVEQRLELGGEVDAAALARAAGDGADRAAAARRREREPRAAPVAETRLPRALVELEL